MKDTKQVERRDDAFTDRQATKIWHEVPHPENPYVATESYCHGYDIVELMQKRSFVETLFLLFRGDLPSEEQS